MIHSPTAFRLSANFHEPHGDHELEDTIEDCVRQSLARWKGDLPRTIADFQAAVIGILGEAIREAVGEDVSIQEIVEQFCLEHGEDRSRQFIKIVSDLVNHPKPVYFADALAFALGLRTRQGISGAALAKKHGVGREAFSAFVLKIVAEYNLPISNGMKNELTHDTYRLTNKRKSKQCN